MASHPLYLQYVLPTTSIDSTFDKLESNPKISEQIKSIRKCFVNHRVGSLPSVTDIAIPNKPCFSKYLKKASKMLIFRTDKKVVKIHISTELCIYVATVSGSKNEVIPLGAPYNNRAKDIGTSSLVKFLKKSRLIRKDFSGYMPSGYQVLDFDEFALIVTPFLEEGVSISVSCRLPSEVELAREHIYFATFDIDEFSLVDVTEYPEFFLFSVFLKYCYCQEFDDALRESGFQRAGLAFFEDREARKELFYSL